MSGIAGIFHLDGRPVEAETLARMSATMAHRGLDGEAHWVGGPSGLACQLNRITPESLSEQQPLASPSGAVLVFDGRIDNRRQLLDALGRAAVSPATGATGALSSAAGSAAALSAAAGSAAAGSAATPLPLTISTESPDSALVLAAYDAFGEGLGERLVGDFAFALFDPGRKRLLLVRDSLGVRPLYYSRIGRTLLFASEIKAILAHPDMRAHPDDDMLADFLLGAPRDPEITFFEGVSCVPPSTLIEVTPDGVNKRRYWDFDPGAEVRLGSLGEYSEAFGELFESAVRRRLRSAYPVAVSVSGGLDSSSILCVAETLAGRGEPVAPVKGLSYLAPVGGRADEEAFLAHIERGYATTIQRVKLGRGGFFDGRRDAVWQVEAPWLQENWDGLRTFHQTARRTGARVLLTGHWGDQMLCSRGYWMDLVHRFAFRQVFKHVNEFGRWFTDVGDGVFRRLFLRQLVVYHLPELAYGAGKWLRLGSRSTWYGGALRRRAMSRSLVRESNAWRSRSVHAGCFYEQVRSVYHVMCLEWNNKVASTDGLEQAFPFLDRDLIAFLMAIPGEVICCDGVPKRLLREALRGVLPPEIAQRRWKAAYTEVANDAMAREFPRLQQSLETDSAVIGWGYVDQGVLRPGLECLHGKIRGPDCKVTRDLIELLGLETWLRVFFERSGPDEQSPRCLRTSTASRPLQGETT